ncbi:MAG: TPM domain-containing protein [Bacteroidales bacterium]|nr:TPM domain-containing protein [Bacteroidales bacterium]
MRYRLENKGLKKNSHCRKIFLIVSFLLFYIGLRGQDIPSPMVPPRLVNDFIGLLSPEQINLLEKDLIAYNDTTSTQIAVVIVKSLNGMDANYFAYKIGETWQVGQKGFNNGVVFLVKPKTPESRGQVAISVGYGLEGVLTDALSKRIIEQEIIPYFRNNQYFEGIQAGVKSIMMACRGQYKPKPKKNSDFEGSPWFALGILAFFFFSFVFSLLQSRRRRHTIGSKNYSDIPFWMLWGSMLGSGGSKGSSWGNFSSGSGSFGGFGGGSFGGGGASGSW